MPGRGRGGGGVSWLDELVIRRDGAVTVIDLSRVRWIDPLHLVATAALTHRATADGDRVVVTGLQGDCARYASRMHLGAVVASLGAEHDFEEVRERDRRDRLLELAQLRTGSHVRELAQLVYDRVESDDADVAAALHNGLAEIGANVFEHSGTFGFMAAQTLPQQGVMRFAVADAGLGVRRTLNDLGAGDDRTAIAMALSGTSRVGGPGRGTGLSSTVTVLNRLGGSLMLASGDSSTYATPRGRRHMAVSRVFSGTVVEGSVPVDMGRHRRGTLYAGV